MARGTPIYVAEGGGGGAGRKEDSPAQPLVKMPTGGRTNKVYVLPLFVLAVLFWPAFFIMTNFPFHIGP